MTTVLVRLGLFAFLASVAAPALGQGLATRSIDAPILYTVKPGDTLYVLGQTWLRNADDYRKVQSDNGVANPRRLKVGSVIRFHPDLLKTRPIDARLSAFSGGVRIEVAGQVIPARLGLVIGEGAVIRTGERAFATFEMPDDSRVTLPSNSAVRVVRLREILLTEAMQRVFALEDGRGLISATPSDNPNAVFQVRTPMSVSAVRGTEFRVNQDAAAGRATTEVIKGGVGVAPPRDAAVETLTPQGFGLAATPEGVGAPVALLAPPIVVRGGRDQEEPAVTFSAQPAAGAVAYRYQLARDAGFVDIVDEAMAQPGATAEFAGVANGTYFVRATAIDAGGIEGLPAAYSFQRDLNVLETGAPPSGEAAGKMRKFMFRWSAAGDGERTYRLEVFGADLTRPIVDLPGLSQAEATITDLPPGDYRWRVTSIRFKAGQFSQKVGALQTLKIGD